MSECLLPFSAACHNHRSPPLDEPHWLATAWTLRKEHVGEATCELWWHEMDRELRLMINADLYQSKLYRPTDGYAWADAAVAWKAAMMLP